MNLIKDLKEVFRERISLKKGINLKNSNARITFWQDKRVICVRCAKPIHKPPAYFIDLAPPMDFSDHVSARASTASTCYEKSAHKAIYQHESLILAQDERWRRA